MSPEQRELAEAAAAFRAAAERVQAALRACYPVGSTVEWSWFGQRRRGVVVLHDFDDLIRVRRLGQISAQPESIDAASIVEAWPTQP